MTLTVDQLWDALRKQCCSTKPFTDAKSIVSVKRDDIVAVIKSLKQAGNISK